MTRYDPNRPWRSFYKTKAWQDRRKLQLATHPLCVTCLKSGQTKAATVVDHVVPHRGDYNLFFFGEVQSLCVTHHNGDKQRIETSGYSLAADEYGFPIDPNHPIYRKAA